MAQILRPLGYSGSLQRLVVPENFGASITAYLWGGGGGGGGGPDASVSGGRGGGGGYSVVNFTVSDGDVIEVAVGGGGERGYVGGGARGGNAGASYVPIVFNSAVPPSGQPEVYRYTNGAYCSFLNIYGVWGASTYETTFDRTYTVYFPTTSTYTFTASCDNYGTIFLDGFSILDIGGYTQTYTTSFTVDAGYHTVREYGVNIGGPGALALTITGSATLSYSGAYGGYSGGSGSSGSGGGSGGATVLLLNGTAIGVAGGGGGGGGAGRFGSNLPNANAPGPRGNQIAGTNNGQNGQNFSGDGGGAGAGGGGYGGGNGGLTAGNEITGEAGSNGGNYGTSTENPSGTTPGGTGNLYYPGVAGRGGTQNTTGYPGYAAIEFNVYGSYIKDSGTYQAIQKTWVKHNSAWQEVQKTYIKDNGEWKPIQGSVAPNFSTVAGYFGIDARSAG